MVETQKEILVVGASEYGAPEAIQEWQRFLLTIPCFYYGAEWIKRKLACPLMDRVGVKRAIRMSRDVFVLAFWDPRCTPDNVERVLRRAPDKRIVNQ